MVRKGCRTGRTRRRQSLGPRFVYFWGPPMTLTAADVAEILRLVEASAFDELSLEFEGLKLNFKRGAGADAVAGTDAAARADAAAGAAGPTAQHVIAAELPGAAAPAAAAPAAPTPIAVDPNSHDLRSP